MIKFSLSLLLKFLEKLITYHSIKTYDLEFEF